MKKALVKEKWIRWITSCHCLYIPRRYNLAESLRTKSKFEESSDRLRWCNSSKIRTRPVVGGEFTSGPLTIWMEKRVSKPGYSAVQGGKFSRHGWVKLKPFFAENVTWQLGWMQLRRPQMRCSVPQLHTQRLFTSNSSFLWQWHPFTWVFKPLSKRAVKIDEAISFTGLSHKLVDLMWLLSLTEANNCYHRLKYRRVVPVISINTSQVNYDRVGIHLQIKRSPHGTK